ncbi:hypothetical protein [Mycobacteroides abscessus]|uniref:hypothetical protein n=1 Tax=Mycobacteroides abscessus TaxID=36809 RepID=UPI001F3F4E6F|nr:hypothetical protein [Mycobacteroides abscessus]
MKIKSSKTHWLAIDSTHRVLRRASGTVAVLAVMAAAIGVPVITPEPTSGTNPVLAIARADCPPDCGPGGGGTPTGPPGGGTEFVPPSMPAMPAYEPGRGQPPLDQNNSISIYNSAAPQPSQAAQPSQTRAENQNGSYGRAANGEQQPINYQRAPTNQEINQDWQNLSHQQNKDPENQAREPKEEDPDKCRDPKEASITPIKTSGIITTRISVDSTAESASGLSSEELTQIVSEAMNRINTVSKAKFANFDESSLDLTPDLIISFDVLGATNAKGQTVDRAWYVSKDTVDAANNSDERMHPLLDNTVRVNASRIPELSDNHDRMVQMIMHEMLHGLGLHHSCAQTVMDSSGDPLVGPPWFAPEDLAQLKKIQG